MLLVDFRTADNGKNQIRVHLAAIDSKEIDQFDNRHFARQCAKVLNAHPDARETQFKTINTRAGDTYLARMLYGITQAIYEIASIDTVEEGGIMVNFEKK